MLKTLFRLFPRSRARVASTRRRRLRRPALALERLETRWVLDGTVGIEQPLLAEPETSTAVPAIVSTPAPRACASGSNLSDFLPSGYQNGPNASSDPVFQQTYADWMACQAQTAQTMPASALSTSSHSPAGGWLDNYAEWFNSTFGSGYSETVGGVIYNILPVSNETLANASDTSLLLGTTIVSIPAAVGLVAGGEVVLGVGTLGGAATTAGTTTTIAAGVTVTEGVAGTTSAVVLTEGTALGTGTILVGAEATTVAGTGTVIVMAEGGSVAAAATGTTIVAGESALGSGVTIAALGVGIPTSAEIAVIGSLEYTTTFIGTAGYDVLYTTTSAWNMGMNYAWIESVIANGQSVLMYPGCGVTAMEAQALTNAWYIQIGNWLFPAF